MQGSRGTFVHVIFFLMTSVYFANIQVYNKIWFILVRGLYLSFVYSIHVYIKDSVTPMSHL